MSSIEEIEYDSDGNPIERSAQEVSIDDGKGSESDDERDYSEEDYDEVRSIQKKKIKRNPVESDEEMEPMKRNRNAPFNSMKNSSEPIPVKKELNMRDYEVNNLLKIVSEYKDLNQSLQTKEDELATQKNLYSKKFLDNNTILKSFEKELDANAAQLLFERKNSEKVKEELAAIKAKNMSDQAQLIEIKKDLFQSQREISTLKSKLLELELSKGNLETELVSVKLENTRILSQEQDLKDQIADLEKEILDTKNTSSKKSKLMINAGYFEFSQRFQKIVEDTEEPSLTNMTNLQENNIFEIVRSSLQRVKDLNEQLSKIQNLDYENQYRNSEISNKNLESELEILKSNVEALNSKLIELKSKNDELTEKLRYHSEDGEKVKENAKNINILNDEIKLRDKIIQELRSLNQAYLEEINSANEKTLEGNLDIEINLDQEKSRINQLYNILKNDWLELRKENQTLKELIETFNAHGNTGQKESFDSKVLKEIGLLKKSLKNSEQELNTFKAAAKEKLDKIKSISRDLLGWEIREREDFVELENTITTDKNSVVVFKKQDGQFHILDTKDHQASFVDEYKELIELFNNSYPMFFSFVNINMKPEFKALLKI